MSKVFVILLNWNGWKDTIQCLESLFKSKYSPFTVIVCDNDSSDDSMAKIKGWAEGEIFASTEIHESLKTLIEPPVKKPVEYDYYTEEEIIHGHFKIGEIPSLILIQNKSNSGFSAGNNVGIRYSLANGAEYIWLLNNDTVVTDSTLPELVERIRISDNTGIVGAVIHHCNDPSLIQAYGGGRIIPFFGIDRFVYSPTELKYITGTSLFARAIVFKSVGLLDEAFFFYWEDADWNYRAIKAGWMIDTAPNAVVYHKFSASVGGQSLKSDLFKVTSMKLYHRKHYKYSWWIPVTFHVSAMLVNRILRKQWDRLFPIIKKWWAA